MSVTWGSDDEKYFRKMGITVDEPQEKPDQDWLVVPSMLIVAVVCGMLWYGIVLAAAWALRALGVHISGI
jgi:hypothetical protein